MLTRTPFLSGFEACMSGLVSLRPSACLPLEKLPLDMPGDSNITFSISFLTREINLTDLKMYFLRMSLTKRLTGIYVLHTEDVTVKSDKMKKI